MDFRFFPMSQTPQRIDMQEECHLDGHRRLPHTTQSLHKVGALHPRRRAEEWTCNSARVGNAFNSIYRLNEQPEASLRPSNGDIASHFPTSPPPRS